MRNILLVEPNYKTKYPPLGLMKISTYHKTLGDNVVFIKGRLSSFREQRWDRIYVSTLFTFYWDETVKTIKYYSNSVSKLSDIYTGGVLATLLSDDLYNEIPVTITKGLIDKPGILDKGNRLIVDSLVPDYSILDTVNFDYELKNSYIGYATRGCIRKCSFCAVTKIEPDYCSYLPLKKQVKRIERLYGEKKNLILMDNNVLASDMFDSIIDDIIALGFYKDACIYKRSEKTGRSIPSKRYVDFNQGLDCRLLTEERVRRLSEIALSPARIAFDDIKYKDIYTKKIKLVHKYGINKLSNYILFNYKDTPEDFYERLVLNINLNEELGTQIYSFPMRYIDLKSKNRKVSTQGNLGINWNRKYLRGIQCILLRTRGIVSPHAEYFYKAFGNNPEEFKNILIMPEKYIINRLDHEKNGDTSRFNRDMNNLKPSQKDLCLQIICNSQLNCLDINEYPSSIRKVLSHYII